MVSFSILLLLFFNQLALKVQCILQANLRFFNLTISLVATAQIIECESNQLMNVFALKLFEQTQNVAEELLTLIVETIIQIVHAVLVEQLRHFDHLRVYIVSLVPICFF